MLNVNSKDNMATLQTKTKSILVKIPMDRLCRLTASFQNQYHKIQSNIFVNIFEAGDY